MSEGAKRLQPTTDTGRFFPGLLDLFRDWRPSPDRYPPNPFGIFSSKALLWFGYLLALAYALLLVSFYRAGLWLTDTGGAPVMSDFSSLWIAGTQVLHGDVSSLYDPVRFIQLQVSLVGADQPEDSYYLNWPYPPIFLLIVAPLGMLSYVTAFLSWGLVTLLGCVAVIYFIVRRPSAIALVLASPVTAWNFLTGQNGALTASLLGASLLLLQRRPVLAGAFMGCLAYKPQFGILLPVAVVAAGQWRVFASAAATIAVLAGVTVATFGVAAWEAFPRELLAQTHDSLSGEIPRGEGWSYFQTVYGLVRAFDGSAALAYLGQSTAAIAAGLVVWFVWRSPARYSLKAATLSAAALIPMPYERAYDMVAIAIPVAFFARDQLHYGWLKGEQTIMITLFTGCLMLLVCLGNTPIGAIVIIALLCMLLRRVLYYSAQPPAKAGAGQG